MVAIAAPQNWKCYSSLAVVPGGMVRVWAIAKSADDAKPLLLERAARYRPDEKGELFNPPEVFCPATVAALNEYRLLTADTFSLAELTAVVNQELQLFERHQIVAGIRAERLQSNLLHLQRKILTLKGDQQ